jgi:glycine hydroxymethyltransferase
MCKDKYAEVIDKAVFPGVQGGPHNHTIAGIAVALKEASQPEFGEHIKQVVLNAKKLAEELQKLGYKIVSGGTDNHLMLVDTVESVGISGKDASITLEKANITLNKNAIPNDPRKPWDPSGIRIGTPAVTTRGMKEPQMEIIAKYINEVLQNPEDESVIKRVKKEVKEFTKSYPIPGIKYLK